MTQSNYDKREFIMCCKIDKTFESNCLKHGHTASVRIIVVKSYKDIDILDSILSR